MPPTRVLIVDDSPLMRHVLSEAISASADFEVVGTARNADEAWTRIVEESPELLTLDIEMPGTDGLTFLERLMSARPMPVVMVSALTSSGSVATLRALRLGALDFVCKPQRGSAAVTTGWAVELLAVLRRAARVGWRKLLSTSTVMAAEKPQDAPAPQISARKCRASVIAIGSGTGSLDRLRILLGMLPRDCPPVVVGQHHAATFGVTLLASVGPNCAMRIRAACDDIALHRGEVIIAVDDRDLVLVRSGSELRLRLQTGQQSRTSRRGLDRLFESCAEACGNLSAGILLDFAAEDGKDGLSRIHASGGLAVREVLDEGASTVANAPQAAPSNSGLSATLERIPSIVFGN